MNVEYLLLKYSLEDAWGMFDCVESNCNKFWRKWFFVNYYSSFTL